MDKCQLVYPRLSENQSTSPQPKSGSLSNVVTPKQAYDQVAARARRMLRLHDGLVNIRKRGIRSDWKADFCRLMRWPQNNAIHRVDSKEALIIIRAGAAIKSTDFDSESIDDLLRSAVAIGIGALDRYVHERIAKGIVSALRGTALTPAQEKLTISAPLALRMTDSLRKGVKNDMNVRPANQFRIAFQESLHRRTFQSSTEIDDAFRMIGIGVWGKLQSTYAVSSVEPIKKQLNEIARRRNLIVHEGDLVRHQRGGRPRINPITKGYVHDSLDFLDTLVMNLEAIS